MAILHQQKKWTYTQTNMVVTYKIMSSLSCLLSLQSLHIRSEVWFLKVSYIPSIIVKYFFFTLSKLIRLFVIISQ